MEPQEVADRLAILDLLARYAHAVDTEDWDAYAALFTADATIDYTAFGGPSGDVASTVEFLRSAMSMFRSTQHLNGLPLIDLDGDTATVRTPCHNPMVPEPGSGTAFTCGLWYRDRLVRTGDGWRFAHRGEDRLYLGPLATDDG